MICFFWQLRLSQQFSWGFRSWGMWHWRWVSGSWCSFETLEATHPMTQHYLSEDLNPWCVSWMAVDVVVTSHWIAPCSRYLYVRPHDLLASLPWRWWYAAYARKLCSVNTEHSQLGVTDCQNQRMKILTYFKFIAAHSEIKGCLTAWHTHMNMHSFTL